jgi:formylglycine-generating enzyme required for sulfatase activity
MKKSLLICTFILLTNSIFSLEFPEMIEIPGGEYVMGNNDFRSPHKVENDGIPDLVYAEHKVKISSFKMSKYEVTFKEYFEFLNDTRYKTYEELDWLKRNEKTLGADGFRKIFFNVSLYPNHPVTRIAYEDALMYCLWLQRKTGKTYRLPTEAEWEYAATGGMMTLYPWGNEYRQLDTSHYNEYIIDAYFANDIFPVDKFKEDRSRFGIYGMYGNATEWCLDAYDPQYYYHSTYDNPLEIVRKYNNNMSSRGSAGYSMETGNYSLKDRDAHHPLYSDELIGFRVVEEIQPAIFNKSTESESIYYYANGVLNDSNVNIRTLPSLDGRKLFQLSNGERVRIYARSSKRMIIGNMSDYWYCVRRLDTDQESEMSTGWIFGSYLDVSEIQLKGLVPVING